MKRGTRAEVSLYIEASPMQLYDLVSDVRRMGEWSPECRSCAWTGGASGPVADARFTGTNRRGLVRWRTKLQVVTARQGDEFAFVKLGHDQTKWTYRFEPRGGGTIVTESFELQHDLPWHIAFIERRVIGIKDRRADLESGMRTTLQRLKRAAEGDSNHTLSGRPGKQIDR
jgi:hypothetical protein